MKREDIAEVERQLYKLNRERIRERKIQEELEELSDEEMQDLAEQLLEQQHEQMKEYRREYVRLKTLRARQSLVGAGRTATSIAIFGTLGAIGGLFSGLFKK